MRIAAIVSTLLLVACAGWEDGQPIVRMARAVAERDRHQGPGVDLTSRKFECRRAGVENRELSNRAGQCIPGAVLQVAKRQFDGHRANAPLPLDGKAGRTIVQPNGIDNLGLPDTSS